MNLPLERCMLHIHVQKVKEGLRELEPIKVWLKYIGPKMDHQKGWIFLCHIVAFCSQIQNI